jgi:hypothetical protein
MWDIPFSVPCVPSLPSTTHTHTHAQENLIFVTAAEDVRDVVVEIESRSISKPFIGGYRHKVTGVEYHHAFTQTPLLHFTVSAGGKYFVVYEYGYLTCQSHSI